MSAISWKSSASGSWTTAAAWSSGTVPGSGDDVTIAVAGVTVTVASAGQAAQSINTSVTTTLAIVSGSLAIGQQADFGGAFTEAGGLASFGNGATFSAGLAQSGGVLDVGGNPLVTTSGGALSEVGGSLVIGNGASLAGSVSLHAGTIALQGGAMAVSGGYVQSGGLLSLAGSGADFTSSVLQTGGTMAVLDGGVIFSGSNDVLGGTLSGAGSLVVAAGTTTLASTAVVSLPKILVTQGTLALDSTFSTGAVFAVGTNGHVILQGNTLDLTGHAVLGGEYNNGTINLSGVGRLLPAVTLDNGVVINVLATAGLTGGAVVNGSLDVAATGTLALTGNHVISGGGTVDNAGLFTKTGGGGTVTITSDFASSGTVAVGLGSMDIDGLNNTLTGLVRGPGQISFGVSNQINGTTDTIGAGTTLTTGSALIGGNSTTVYLEEQLSYAGAWQENGGTLFLDGGLALHGSAALDGGLIKSAGTLVATGLVSLAGVDFEGTTHSTLTAQVIQSSSITLGGEAGTSPTLTLAHGATWALEGPASIDGADGTVVNDGTITKAGGASDVVEQGTLTNAGTVAIAAGTLSLTGSAALGGLINGQGVLDLAGAATLDSGLVLQVGQVLISEPQHAQVALAGNISYLGLFTQADGTIALQGNTLRLAGSAYLDGGTLAGPGTVTSAGIATVGNYTVGSRASLILTHGGEQTADVTVQSGGNLTIAAGATYALDDTGNIAGPGTLTIAGTLAAHGLLDSTLSPNVVDTGLITAGAGELSFLGAVTGTGTITTAANGQIDFGAASSAASSLHVNLVGNASLLLENAQQFAGLIGGFASGDFIEISGLVSGSITETWNAADTQITLTDQQNHSFLLNFASAVTIADVSIGIGPHGYIGIAHS